MGCLWKKLTALFCILALVISAVPASADTGSGRSLGDMNGDGRITAVDALLVLRSISDPTEDQFRIGNVNGDDELNVTDALWVLQVAAGQKDGFPQRQESERQSIGARADTTVQSWKHQKAFNNGALAKMRLRYAEKQTDNTFYHDPAVTDSNNTVDIKFGYVKFDTDDFPDLSHGIRSAYLSLAPAENAEQYTIDIMEAASGWTEGSRVDTAVAADGSEGMTWYSRPDIGRQIAAMNGTAANQYADADVTEYVKSRAGEEVTFAILSDESNGTKEFTIHTRESGYAPQLIIEPYSNEEIEQMDVEQKKELEYIALTMDKEYHGMEAGSQIPLARRTAYTGSEITWTSASPDIISDSGRIVADFGEKAEVTMTALIHEREKSFTFTLYSNSYTRNKIEISSRQGAKVDGSMFGLFFEDINYAADGGIMAEMIENYSFEFFNSGPAYNYGWSTTGSGASLSIQDTDGLNDNNPHYAVLTVTDPAHGIKNKAYDGIYLNAENSYHVSLYAQTDQPLLVSAEKNGKQYGTAALSETDVTVDCVREGWKKYEGDLHVEETLDAGDFVIRLQAPGTARIDMVSCVSSDAVLGRFRKDLTDKLEEMHPGFLRFPGGCAVEGGATLDTAYRWKDTVGALEQRKLNKSRWQVGDSRYYCQSFNLGFYEYFQLCEYLGAEPVPVVNAGLACMTNSNPEAVPVYKDAGKTIDTATEEDLTDAFMGYVNDILDLIDFANSMDFDGNKWAALRRDMGHEQPFSLNRIGIGNEQWERGGNQWHDRYYWIEHFVHKKDPSMKLMSSAAWYYTGNAIHDNEYQFVYDMLKKNPDFTYAVDEHYYETPDWFYSHMDYYDTYSREANVFLGEVSARWEKKPGDYTICTLENAIAEAAYFTMLERNSDIIKMVSAAPLFCRVGGTKYSQWSPNLIWFDGKRSFETPSYYVQTMYGQNSGDYNYRSDVTGDGEECIYSNTVYDEDEGELIIKVVNASDAPETVRIHIDDSIALAESPRKVITLANEDKRIYNTVEEPEKIAPVTTWEEGDGNTFTREFAANSFTILRVPCAGHGKTGSQYQVAGYTRGTDLIGGSLHLAVSDDYGETFQELNSGEGVLFGKADYAPNWKNGINKNLVSPYLFRLADGGYGIAAEECDAGTTSGKLVLYRSESLTSFDDGVRMEIEGGISDLVCEYQNGNYLLSWTADDGERYEAETDLTSVSEKRRSGTPYTPPDVNLEGAVNALPVSSGEYRTIRNAWSKIKNTGVDPVEPVYADAQFSEKNLPRVTARYSDGSTAQLPVDWELSGVNFREPGTYTVSGEVSPAAYQPIPNKADPEVLLYRGTYYFISTDDTNSGAETWQRKLLMRSSDTLEGLADAEDVEIFHDPGNVMLWAPELHEVDGTLCIFYAAMTDGETKTPQSHVMELTGPDPMNPDDWSDPMKILDQNGNDLVRPSDGISLDMTCFALDGKNYVAWSKGVSGGSARIELAEYDPETKRLASEIVEITAPYYGWERSEGRVDEGPFVIEHDGRVFMTFAGNKTNRTYCVGLLELTEKTDPLRADSWKKYSVPVLGTAHDPYQPGPGHGSFTVNQYGDAVFVYHWGTSGIGRTTQMRTVHWNADGLPVLYLDADDEILPEYQNVTMELHVTEPSDYVPPERPKEKKKIDLARYVCTDWASRWNTSPECACDGLLPTVWNGARNGTYYVSYLVFDAGEGKKFDLARIDTYGSTNKDNVIYFGTDNDRIVRENPTVADGSGADLSQNEFGAFADLYDAARLASTGYTMKTVDGTDYAYSRETVSGQYRYLIAVGTAWTATNVNEIEAYGEIVS